MKNKINKISNQSGIKKLSLIIKKLNRKTSHKAAGRKITIDELALMIGKGFRGMDERFAGVDARFNKMDARFEAIKERLDRIEMKLDSLERRIFAIENILTEHRNILNEHGKDIKEIKTELKALKKLDNGNSDKIFALEQRVGVLEVAVA